MKRTTKTESARQGESLRRTLDRVREALTACRTTLEALEAEVDGVARTLEQEAEHDHAHMVRRAKVGLEKAFRGSTVKLVYGPSGIEGHVYWAGFRGASPADRKAGIREALNRALRREEWPHVGRVWGLAPEEV